MRFSSEQTGRLTPDEQAQLRINAITLQADLEQLIQKHGITDLYIGMRMPGRTPSIRVTTRMAHCPAPRRG